jgi:haloalkane dehalogenase
MKNSMISAEDPYIRRRIAVLDTDMAYIDVGAGDPIVFLHGNPTSSYLWRQIIPHLQGLGRCLAPDLVGMGASGKAPQHSYRFVDHARYLDSWFDALDLATHVTLVVHDWGSALGFYWAQRHLERIKGIAYMEAIVRPLTWQDWDQRSRSILETIRSSAGEQLVLEENVFVERLLPAMVIRRLGEQEMEAYRRPYLQPGESRRPTLTWPRELPIEGEPADVVQIVDGYARWLAASSISKLFVNADPGWILTGAQREFCRTFPHQEEVRVKGLHFVQEDSPAEIGEAIADFVKRASAF